MSERKAEYYAKHLEQQVPGGNVILGPGEQMEMIQPSGLPTLLARMAIEYEATLLPNGTTPHPHSDALVEDFNRILLAAAQPLLTEYLTAITTPPKFVVKQQQDEASLPMMVRAVLAAERVAAKEPADPVKALLLEYQQYAENLPVWQHALSFPEWRKGLGAK